MSNRIFQDVVVQIRDIINVDGGIVGVAQESGVVCACSEPSMTGTNMEILPDDFKRSSDVFVRGEYTYKPIGDMGAFDYIVFIKGTDATAAKQAELAALSLLNVKLYFDEKYDRANFIKNVILDNILPGDVYMKARELRFNIEATHVVILIRLLSRSEISVLEIIQNLFPERKKDFVINISDNEIAIVKETKRYIDTRTLEKLAKSILETLSTEFYIHAIAGIGTSIEGLRDLAKSYKEARVALEVGKVFDTEKDIICYENLGIARLIYQLPTTLCNTFLSEVFKTGSIESLDQETLFTIQKFFENNLNVSETSRKLFVHRNTLVYRLEKIKKLTALDLREFDHAIVFKIALMVKKYLTAMPMKF